jgi:hypothetical protein
MPLHLRLIPVLSLAWCVFWHASEMSAGAPKEARISQLVRDVRLLGSNGSAQPASLNDIVHEGTSLRTGPEARAELTFTDQTLARLGDDTLFGFSPQTKTFDLTSGAILIQVPKNSGRAQLKVASITAAIKGTTLLLEYQPDAYIKFIFLDGTGRLCLKKRGRVNDCVLLHAGQMLIVSPHAKGLPDAVDVDLERLLKTCRLLTEFPQLPRQGSLAKAADEQHGRKSRGGFIDTNLVIFGRGTLVSLVDPNAGKTKSPPSAVSPSPTPVPDSNSQSSP